ncbi:hypothetical protein P7K49_033479 [Saguinus oedipus]|uniref:Uncharacterized protein n=1 Tax=Saguinus oedipus TaxID=9490 RepID=A0ABQ9TS22_SAGOE|nr:hypothetical protein P7K49_033479 [Saguinus oedipus]
MPSTTTATASDVSRSLPNAAGFEVTWACLSQLASAWAQSNEDGMRLVEHLSHYFHDVHLWWFGPFYPVVRLIHPKFIAPVLQAPAEVAPKDMTFYGFLKPWLGNWRNGAGDSLLGPGEGAALAHGSWLPLRGTGLLLKGGDNWRCQRRLLTLAFHFDILKPCVKIFNKSVNIMHAKWQHLALEGSARLDMFEPHDLEQSAEMTCDIVHNFTDAIIQEHRRTHTSQGVDDFLQAKAKSRTLDFIDVLLLAKPRDPSLPGCPSGHDTTASGLSWVLYNLAEHPEYQEHCRQEVQELLKGHDLKEIEWDDLAQLPFLTMCLKESLRLHPPVPLISRHCIQDVVLPDGRVIPKGNICSISIAGVHHNPSVWPDPEVLPSPPFSIPGA